MKKLFWGLIPITLCVMLFFGYHALSHYSHKLLQDIGVAIWGAPVEIETIQLSYFPFKFILQNVQVIDQDNPSQNLFQVEKIIANVQLKPLLHRQLIVDSLEATNVLLSTPNQGPKLKAEGSQLKESPALVKQDLEEVDLTPLKSAYDLTPLLNSASLKRNERLSTYQKTLEFDLNRLKRTVEEKKISERLTLIEKDFSTLQNFHIETEDDLEKLPQMLASIQSALTEISNLKKDIPELKETQESTYISLQNEFKGIGSVESDYHQLSPKIPQSKARLDNVTEALLKDRIFYSLKTILSDFNQIKLKLDSNRTSKNAIPFVWVKSLTLSGKDARAVRLTGLISHFSTHQSLIQLPTVASLDLYFPDGNKISIDLLADVRNGNDKTQFLAEFEEFKLSNFPILTGDSPVFLNAGRLNGKLIFGDAGRVIDGYFHITGSDFNVDKPYAKEIEIDSLLSESLSSMDVVKIEGTFSGTADTPELHLSSTLDEKLGNLTNALASAKDELLRRELKRNLKTIYAGIQDNIGTQLQGFQTILPADISSDTLKKLEGFTDVLTALKTTLSQQASTVHAHLDQAKHDQEVMQQKAENEKADAHAPQGT